VEWKAVWLAREQTGKEPLAFDQRLAPQIPPIQVQKVESEEERVTSRPGRKRLLEGAKIGNADAVLHDGFAIDIGGLEGQPRRRIGNGREPRGPIEAASSQQPHASALDAHMQPLAVPFDLVQPASPPGTSATREARQGSMNSGKGSSLSRLPSSLAGNRSAALRALAELGGDARARFERVDSVLFGMPKSNAERCHGVPPNMRRSRTTKAVR
jgi:hypothetical protein